MATPPQSFQLDRTIFNQTLYAQLRELWFESIPKTATAPSSPDTFKRWYGLGSEEEKAAFDAQCRQLAGHALEAAGPSKLNPPVFSSHDEDVENAEDIARPFLQEVKEAQHKSEDEGADTLLSLVLLMDQMPRNIYRDPAGLRLVYGHYDRLALALARSSLELSPKPLAAPFWKGRPVYKSWLWLPLVHSEHLPSHRLAQMIMADCKTECEEAEDNDALDYIAKSVDEHMKHMEPLERFGRYPHRNECLRRQSTAEEEKYLETASTFGVKQQSRKATKDEL